MASGAGPPARARACAARAGPGSVVDVRFWNRLLERYLGLARGGLTPDAAERARAEGRRLTLEEAIAASQVSPPLKEEE